MQYVALRMTTYVLLCNAFSSPLLAFKLLGEYLYCIAMALDDVVVGLEVPRRVPSEWQISTSQSRRNGLHFCHEN